MIQEDDGGDGSDLSVDADGRCEIDLRERDYAIYRRVDCDNVVLSIQDCEGGMTCHGETMERVTESTLAIQPPDIRQVLLDAFDLPKPGVDICLCVIGDGPLSPAELADRSV